MQSETPFPWPEGKRAALSLTFDDARPTQLDHGLPILDRYGIKATFYVSVGPLKSRLGEWRAALENGHEIGNHTLTHPCSGNFAFSRHNALEDYTLDRMEAEIAGADGEIEEMTGVRPSTFAYPCGQTYVGRGEGLRSYVPLVARRFTAGRGFNGESANHPALCDLAHLLSTSADRLSWDELRLWLDSTVGQGDWLILTAHEVGPEPRHQVMTEDALDAVCRYAADPGNGVWVAPVSTIGAFLNHHRRGAE